MLPSCGFHLKLFVWHRRDIFKDIGEIAYRLLTNVKPNPHPMWSAALAVPANLSRPAFRSRAFRPGPDVSYSRTVDDTVHVIASSGAEVSKRHHQLTETLVPDDCHCIRGAHPRPMDRTGSAQHWRDHGTASHHTASTFAVELAVFKRSPHVRFSSHLDFAYDVMK
jgi:hypothetical protein